VENAIGPIVTPSPIAAVNAASNIPGYSASRPVPCHAIMFQTLLTNLGRVYIGRPDMDPTTMEGVFCALGVPTINLTPNFSVAITLAPNALNLGDYWVMSDLAGEGIFGTYLVL